MGEIKQPTVIAASNRVIKLFQYNEIQGKIIKNTQEKENFDSQTYILNSGGIIPIDQLVESKKVKAENARYVSEYITVRIFNKTGKTINIRKGSVIATVEEVSNETLTALTEYTVEKALQNYEILTARFSSNASEIPRSTSAHPVNDHNNEGECVPPHFEGKRAEVVFEVGGPEKMFISSQVATVVSSGVGGPEKIVTSS